MTAPRYVVPGATYLITRRTSERRFFLRPHEMAHEIFAYCLAEAAERFGVSLLAWTVLSNHYHAVVEDPSGRIPDFLCHLHKMTARATNVLLGRREAFWSSEPASVVRLVDLADVRDKVAYTLANPVRARLVARAREWVGENALRALHGATRVLRRPLTFFRPGGDMPEIVTLRASTPSAWPGSRASWASAVDRDVRDRERLAAAERARRGTTVLGVDAARRVAVNDRPRADEPRRTLRPELACLDFGRRVAELLRLREFRVQHERARTLLAQGVHALLPEGTFKLARLLGQRLRPTGPGIGPPLQPSASTGVTSSAPVGLRSTLHPES